MDLVTGDKETLEKYFLERFPDALIDEEAYHLLLLVISEKPGALIMSAGEEERKLVEDFSKEIGLEIKVIEGEEQSLLDRLFGRESMIHRDSIYLAQEAESFKSLEASEGDFNGFSDQAVGEFLGYPSDSIKFYMEDGIPGRKFDERLKDLIDRGVVSEDDLDYLNLVGYLPSPEKDGILKAIEVAKKREEMLQKLDSKLDTSIGKEYLKQIKA
ncbi:MAG: hypothetical protein V5A72_00730 [Candidatus Nanohaloarchaea archaeon]